MQTTQNVSLVFTNDQNVPVVDQLTEELRAKDSAATSQSVSQCSKPPHQVQSFQGDSCYQYSLKTHPLIGLVVKASTLRAEDLGFHSCLRCGNFCGSSHTSDLKIALQWLPCQVPGVMGSVLGLAGLVSVYCDWVRFDLQLLSQCGSTYNSLSRSVPEIH